MHIARIIFCLVLFLMSTSGIAQSSSDQGATLLAKGDSCRYACLYNKALSFYQQAYSLPSVKNDTELQLQLLERIVRTHDVLYQWKELSETSYQLYELAKKHDDQARMASALFMKGKRMHLEGQKVEGYRLCLDAIRQMKDADYPLKYHELTAFYGILARMYGKDGAYQKGMQMSEKQEEYVRLASNNEGEEHGRHGLQRVYVIRVWLLANMGRQVEADSLYRRYAIQPIGDPICGDALLQYYKMCQKNEDALRFLHVVMHNVRADGDTLGRNMQRLLDDEGDVYYRMGDFQKAAECYIGVTALADTLGVRSLRITSEEVQRAIDNEHAVSVRNLILATVVAGVLLLLVVVALVLRHDRIMNKKNRAMTQTIRELIHYRDLVITNGNSVEMGENGQEEKEIDDEKRRFKVVDKRVVKEELFRNPDFGRDELMRLMGVDKNAISSIISQYTGMNVTGYINTKRMEYAVSLMKQHPENTLAAISEACGIKSQATFIRNFRNAYGLTPSEFRRNLEELPPPNGHIDNNF